VKIGLYVGMYLRHLFRGGKEVWEILTRHRSGKRRAITVASTKRVGKRGKKPSHK